jgi:hypothetical protein
VPLHAQTHNLPVMVTRCLKKQQSYCSCKLYVRSDDLDPRLVTALLGVEPSEAYLKGEHKILRVNRESPGKPSNLIIRTGTWRLDINEEKKWSWDAAAQLEYWCAFLTSREAAVRELQAHCYEVMVDCYIDEGPIVYVDLSGALMQSLGNLVVALKFGFYDGENLQAEKTQC